MCLWWDQRPRSRVRTATDAGFTLVELMVALLLIGVVVSSLITLQVGSLRTVTLAKQRQTATAFANQVVEQIRALPYATLSQGLDATDVTADAAWVTSGRLKAPWDEKVVTSSGQTSPVLNPHVSRARTVEGASYVTRRYVTLPKDSTGTDVTTTNDFWLTVVTQWTSSVTRAQTKQVVVRNRVVMPVGCKGTVDHPYAGPCQPFFYADASWSGGDVTVMNGDDADPGLFLEASTQPVLTLPGLAATVQVEQLASARGRAVTSGTILGEDSTGQVGVEVASDVDPATGLATAPPAATGNQGTGLLRSVPTEYGGVIDLSPSSGDTGKAAAGAVVPPGTGCFDLAGSSLSGARSCASSEAKPLGDSVASLDLGPTGGIDLGAMTLASVAAPTTSTPRALAARFTTGTSASCTDTTGDGCAAARVAGGLGTVTVGGLPAGATTLPSGLGPAVVSLTGYQVSAASEIGVSSAAAGTANRFTVVRTGTLSYWTGTGPLQKNLVDLAGGATLPVGPVSATYGSGETAIVIDISGQVSVGAPVVRKTTGTCEPDACVGEARSGRIVVDLDYAVRRGVEANGGLLTTFHVTVDLGELVAKTTYRAVPNV